jgi:AraC-like DNA-binding protein
VTLPLQLEFQDVAGLSVCRYDYQPGWKLVSHRHESFYQIFHLFDGTGLAWIAGEPVSVQAGQVIFIAPGVEHGLRPTGNRPLRTLDVKFRIHSPSLVRLTLDFDTVVNAEDEEIYPLLESIRTEAEHRAPYFQQICQLKLAELLLRLARSREHREKAVPQSSAHGPLPTPAVNHPLVRTFLAYLAGHYREMIDADRLERDLAYSYRHLTQLTQEAYRMTPRQVLAAFRISVAQRDMLNGSAPLKEIAESCGFANVHHFSRVFKQTVGESPASWRTSHKSPVYKNFTIDPSFSDRDRTIR